MAARILRSLSKNLERNSKFLTTGCLQNMTSRSQPCFYATTHIHPSAIPSSLTLRSYSSKTTKREKPERVYESDSDSDSDTESRRYVRGKERGTTEFWRRKMRTIHGILDVNNDGVISYDDFKLLADKFAALGHLSAQECEEFQNFLRQTWEEQWGEVSPYNLVTAEQYISEMRHRLNDKDQSKKIHLFLPYLFKAVDNDKSGYISLKEFKLFFKCLGLTSNDAMVSFSAIDKNGDGKISIKEFVKLGRDYYFAEDESKISKMFWGPLAK